MAPSRAGRQGQAKMKKCLESDEIPDPNPDCEFCRYRQLIKKQE